MRALVAYIKAHIFVAGAIGFALVVAAFYAFSGGNGEEVKTLTVQKGTFLQQVSLSGKVIAAQDVDLGFSQGGRVSRVYVKVGDVVSAGRTLAEVENGDLRASVLQRQAALETAEAELAAVKSGARPERIAILQSEIDSKTVALTQAKQALIEAIQDAYVESESVVRNTFDQFVDNPRTSPQLKFFVTDGILELRVENTRLDLERILTDWQAESAALSGASDLLSATKTAQERLQKVSMLLQDANSALNKGVQSAAVSSADITAYIADIGAARASLNAAISSLTSAVTAEKNAQAALDVAKKNLTLEQAGGSVEDVAAQLARVKAAEADLQSARAQLSKTIISAPFSGTVTAVEAEVGETVSGGGVAISLIGNGTLQIESFVPEINLALLSVGNTATVTLDAYGSDVPFEAVLSSIDPAETIKDGVSTYRAILVFTGKDERVRPGMTANVSLTTQEKEGVISIPVGAVELREGKAFVKVLSGKETSEREVEVGATSSLGNIEITAGLAEGDVIVLP